MTFLKHFRPGLLTWLVTATTGLTCFYVTVVVEELRSGHTATYRFHTEDDNTYFTLRNLSRAHQISAANIQIRCGDQRPDCFDLLTDEKGRETDYVSLQLDPPNFGRPLDAGRSNPTEINVCLGAIAGSATTVKIRTQDRKKQLRAFYNPWAEWCEPGPEGAANLLLLKPLDPHAIATRYYFWLVSAALAICISLLALTGASLAAGYARKESQA